MYENKNLKKSFEEGNNSDDEFDFCNTETGQKFTIKWSPSEELKYLSKNRFSGTRPLSRSVPRRKRSLFQYKINRSLNFEIGTPRHQTVFKSPNFDSDDSPICNEKYLTRSAKILRSLNINFSPSNKRNKKINKTLNFDSSPSPKRIFSSAESICNKESPKFDINTNRMSKINKTLNFSSSSNSSNFSSYLGSSVDSIDENQNQTPSQRNRKVKKSLNYLTPSPTQNVHISRSINNSPMSRDEFIQNLKHNAEISNSPIIKQSANKKSKHIDGITVSTPRNLFQDFEDDEKEMRPSTPENVIQFIPESMSAIKKSHKKERQSNRSEKLYTRQLKEHYDKVENTSENPIVLSHSEERPSTPITNDSYPSPNYSIGSIKQSHKKDKSKKRTVINHSEDEISEFGSIFDYSELQEESPLVENEVFNNEANHSSPLSNASSDFGIVSFKNNTNKRSMCLNNSVEELSDNGSIFDYSETPVTLGDVNVNNSPRKMNKDRHVANDCHVMDKEPLKLPFDKLELVSPVKYGENLEQPGSHEICENEGRPVTPKNVINVLEQVMSDSIKKSHKKIKDRNKKTLFKSQGFVQELPRKLPSSPDNDKEEEKNMNTEGDPCTPESVVRAGTPENVNSSRLLLRQYSSVKKSHKKNKHKKIVTEFVKRQKYFNNDDRRKSSDNSCGISGVETLSSPRGCSNSSASKKNKSLCDESSPTALAINKFEMCSTPPIRRSTNDRSIEFSAADVSPLERSTPNKRKKSYSLNETGASSSTPDFSHVDSSSMDYESAEEEFKIFTPIKKRRSLPSTANNKELPTTSSQLHDSKSPEKSNKNCPAENESFQSIENSFSTPLNHGIRENNSDQKICREGYVDENMNGRSTPKNSSTSEMIFDVNSIKKSHKKDKKNSRMRRHLNIDDEKDDFRPLSDEKLIDDCISPACHETAIQNDLLLKNDYQDPKPSTSLGIISTEIKINDTDNKDMTKTPPNCSKVISYLKLRQGDSIKRSHKKIREQKKPSAIINDPNLSDDGSIFDSSERILLDDSNDSITIEDNENSSNSRNENIPGHANGAETPQLLAQTPPNRSKLLIKIESIKKSHKKVREFRRLGTKDQDPDLSDDGSIFDPDEKLDESMRDGKEIMQDNEKSSLPN